ncbi:MAG: glycosyltransferase family 2 protein [Armatimonadota bacterium]|nr:glycosyltransferase family 2 protein [bacterium]
MTDRCSIIIPNYNGVGIIGESLASLRDTAGITVVDDASTDGTPDFIARQFPHVNILRRTENAGFSVTVNHGIRSTSSELVALLNNDVVVEANFLDALMPLFSDPEVFSVGPRILLPSHDYRDEGCAMPRWYHGMLYGSQSQGVTDITPVLYTTGCAAIYRRSMLEELGGFDETYSPFYWEDVDLGYRAWKRGWKSLYQPASTVYHQHSASISRIKKNYTDRIKARNSLFFIWRNIEDSHILHEHRHWLPIVLAKRIATGDTAFLSGWRDAYLRRNEASSARACDSQHRVMSDHDIFAICGVDLP